jgi:beta-mannanase
MVAGAALAGMMTLVAGGGAASAQSVVTNARSATAGAGSLSGARPASKLHTAGRLTAANTFPTKGGILFGGTDQIANLSSQLGRNLAIIRVYYTIGQSFPSYIDNEHMSEGSTLLVSLDSNGQSYAGITSGQYDTTINTFLAAVNAAAVKYDLTSVFITFQHEPDNSKHASLGTPAEFVAAWDHVHALAAAADLDWNQGDGGRLMWTLILLHNTYAIGTNADGYWPGASEVDVVATDGYNSYGCSKTVTSNQTPTEIFSPLLSFAKTNGGMPVIIAEWASYAGNPAAQVTFIQQMQTYLTNNHRKIKAADYWDDAGAKCSYKIDSNPASIAALKVLGASADLQGTAHS